MTTAAPAPADGTTVRTDSARRAAAQRLTSLDVFRGVTMVFMASEILHIPSVARKFPSSDVARFLAAMLDHRAWVGCVPWDLIQPAFMFMVGVALPYSIASRQARGQSFGRMLAHARSARWCSSRSGSFCGRSRARRPTSPSKTC